PTSSGGMPAQASYFARPREQVIYRSRDCPYSRSIGVRAMRTTFVPMSAKSIRFSIDKEHCRRIEVEPGVMIYHLYPTLSAWVGREAPDDLNPRSHEDQALTGSVPKAIEQTLRECPEDFYLANRGETILAQSVSFNPDKQVIEIVLTDYSGDSA